MTSPTPLVPEASLLIRKPARDVYRAFVEPSELSKFWLYKASAPLEVGKTILWQFKFEGADDQILVKTLEPGKRIVIEWDQGVQVEWIFEDKAALGTYVRIQISQIKGTAAEQTAYALDVVQGFTLALCELKAWLEHGLHLNLIWEKYPDGPKR